MTRRILTLAAVAACVTASPALAQDKRVEGSVLFGWTFSDGVSSTAVTAADGNVYNRIDPKDSFKWGLDFGVFATEHFELGFLFGQQLSTLTAAGTATRDIGDMTINTYHGYFAYNFGESSAQVRPYLLLGLGATSFASVNYTTAAGSGGTINGQSKFSSAWGAGVKFYPKPNVGARLGVQWTPTYIKSDATGYWCDPYWGCYLVGSAQYSNQWDLSAGITFRF